MGSVEVVDVQSIQKDDAPALAFMLGGPNSLVCRLPDALRSLAALCRMKKRARFHGDGRFV